MSAPLAGRFQDHYKVLGGDPKGEIESITHAWTPLVKKFRPENPDNGDDEKFEASTAYKVLSDPGSRWGASKP